MTEVEEFLIGQCRVLCSEVKTLVSLLPAEWQLKWLDSHKENCKRLNIDPTTGEKLKATQ